MSGIRPDTAQLLPLIRHLPTASRKGTEDCPGWLRLDDSDEAGYGGEPLFLLSRSVLQPLLAD